ncbi:MAG: PIG-L family deacetylase, partial [Planctomycetes bacterium]|nr:PIG-L family deacetylase [Planctomycetota bacterium]
MTRLLVIAAHPDDETLGAGATLARAARAGDEIVCCTLCDVTTSRRPRPSERTLAGRRAEQAAAARALGIGEVVNFRLPDQVLDTQPRLSLVQRLAEVVGRVRPEIV